MMTDKEIVRIYFEVLGDDSVKHIAAETASRCGISIDEVHIAIEQSRSV